MNELIGNLIQIFPRNSNNISRCSTNIEENNENNNNKLEILLLKIKKNILLM